MTWWPPIDDALGRAGLDDRIGLLVASATALPFPDGLFDGATMLHVGMNVEDRPALLAEVGRVLRPGGCFGIYDVVRAGAGPLTYPVPWASSAETSHLAAPEEYRRAAEEAGLVVEAVVDRSPEARAFFERVRASSGKGGPPPLGLHLVMGPEASTKVANLVAAVEGGAVAPTELVLRRPVGA